MGPPRFEYEDQHYPPARDKDYRIHADPVGQLEEDVDEIHTGAHDVDIRVKPAELFHTSNAEPVDTGLFPAAFASTETRVTLGSSVAPNVSQGSMQSHHRICSARLPVPEHLMPAFEEAAASTGAWPPKGPETDQTEGGKKRVLPAWLRDELEKLEKKKAKELAVVSGDTVLGAAPDAERDAEGDIVMAADEDETKTGHLSEVPVKPLVDDDLSDDDEERGVDDDEEDVEVNTVVETSDLAAVTAASRSKAVPSESACVTIGAFEGTADPDVSMQPTSPKMEGAVDRVIPEISHEYDNKSGVKRATPESSSALLSLEEFRAKFAALTDEEQQLETARFITRTLTDVLLAVTSEVILTTAQETLSAVQLEEEHKSKQPPGHDKPAVEVIAVHSGLAGLVAYNSDSDSESEQNELRKSPLTDVADDSQPANSDVAETVGVSSEDAKPTGHSRIEHDHPDSTDRRVSVTDVSPEADAHGNVGNSESRARAESQSQSRHSRDSLSPTSSSERSKDRHRHRGHRKKSKSHQKSKRRDRSTSPSRSHHRPRSPSSSRRPSKRHHKRDHERSAGRHRSRDSSSTSSSTNLRSCSSKLRRSRNSDNNPKRHKRHQSQTRRQSSNLSDSFQKSKRKKHQSDVSSSDSERSRRKRVAK
ncbi:hypothetical protein P879_02823 [Paragonimus westermani]|uniref:Uncharacterized protein n=1 Tax=Paragonimus westermani TaxID=34504 RepID=A0A8T0DTT8_9TREM|nr:hypothetical protein P879_02823 [Paragonimus westermani]